MCVRLYEREVHMFVSVCEIESMCVSECEREYVCVCM